MTDKNTERDVLAEENAQLKEELVYKSGQLNSLSGTHVQGARMVPVKNFSGSEVSIPYEYAGVERNLRLGTTAGKNAGSLPLEVWSELESNDNRLITQGYVARTDIPITNVNVIENLEEFMRLSEPKLKARVKQMTNPSSLYRLLNFIEVKRNEKKTGKILSALDAVRDQIHELTNVRIVDGDGDTESISE